MANGLPTTQNNVEAWHCRIGVIVGRKHAGLYNLIEHLAKEYLHMRVQQNLLRAGEQPLQSKQKMFNEKRIRRIIDNRASWSKLDFLIGISSNFSLTDYDADTVL